MTAGEFKDIAEYVRGVGLALKEWELYGNSAEIELVGLQRTITRLADAGEIFTNEQSRAVLAKVERTARQCRQIILRRNGLEN